nr:unnamed protein product [Callosobruchus chinensis]
MSIVHVRSTDTMESVYDSLNSFLIVCNLLGLTHLRLECVDGFKYLTLKYRLMFLSGIYAATLIWLNKSSDDKDVTIKVDYNYTVMYTAIKLIDIGNIVLFITIFAMSCIINTTLKGTINTSTEIDAIFFKLDVKVEYSALRKYERAILISGIAMLPYTFMFHVYHFKETISLKLDLRFCLPLMIRYFFGYQYCILTKMAQEKFNMLNVELTRIIKNSEKVNFIVTEDYSESNKQLKKIKYCMKIYHNTAKIIRTYNTIFAPQLIVTYTTLFIDTISDLICAYDDIKANYSLSSAVVWTNWLTLYIIQMSVMTFTCCKTTDALMVFIRQIQHESVKCSPFNLFSIDTGLLFSIAKDSTAYLLALFQYQENIEIQCLEN